MWGSWTGTRPAQQWVQYDWDDPVRVDRARIEFWSDAAPGTGNGVSAPSSWALQYWDAGRLDATCRTRAATRRRPRPLHTVTFDAVTTTRAARRAERLAERGHPAAVLGPRRRGVGGARRAARRRRARDGADRRGHRARAARDRRAAVRRRHRRGAGALGCGRSGRPRRRGRVHGRGLRRGLRRRPRHGDRHRARRRALAREPRSHGRARPPSPPRPARRSTR